MAGYDHYELLARLFDYPERDFPSEVAQAIEFLLARCPGAATELALFAELLPTQGGQYDSDELDEAQELFTRSFQVQAVATLDVGYVAFGDDYKRGELLVNLKREHRNAGLDCGSELADHLPNILRLMARWADHDTMAEFVELILHPAVEQMIEEFVPSRLALRNELYKKHHKTLIVTSEVRGRLYRHALTALRDVLRDDFKLGESAKPERTSAFLRNITRELDIEARGEGARPALAQLPRRN